MNKDLDAIKPEELQKGPPARSVPSPTNIFPGNRLQHSGAPATAATVAPRAQPAGSEEVGTAAGRVTAQRQPNGVMAFSGGDVSGPVSYANSTSNPLVNAVESAAIGASAAAGRGFVNPPMADPSKPPPTMAPEVRGPAAGNQLVNWDRSGMTNAQVGAANPQGRVQMTRQPNGTMSFSGGDVSGPVSYTNIAGNPLVGGGIRGNGFSRVDSTPAGASVGMDGAGNYAFPSGNPLVGGASTGRSADGMYAGQAQREGAMQAAGGTSAGVDAAVAAAAQRGDWDAVHSHFAGRGLDFGGQGAAQPSGAGFSGSIGQDAGTGNMWGRTPEQQRRDAETQASSIHQPTAQRGAAALESLDAMEGASAKIQGEQQIEAMRQSGSLQRDQLREQGENYRAQGKNALAAATLAQRMQEEGRTSAYQAAQLDFSQQRLNLDRERAQRDGLPQGYRRTQDGHGLEAIPGGPADPAVVSGKATLNDVQSKALQFGARMLQSGQTIDQLAADGVTQPGYLKRVADTVGAGALANWTQSQQQQQVEQGQRDFVNAVLRRESGAAISNSEFDNARKQYFPQPGDSQQVIEQKRRNRDLATAGVLAEVPNQQARLQQVLGAAGQQSAGQVQQRTVVRTGMYNGRKVQQYSDGSTDYAD